MVKTPEIEPLKPYPEYKDSGVPWLGKVPKHWEVHSFGSLISPISQRGQPGLPLLSVVREKGVIPRTWMSEDENHNFVPNDLSNYKVVRKGNLVINKMKAWQGSLGIAPMDGIVSPAYFVFNFRIGDKRFGQALLRSKTYVAFFGRESGGIRIGQWDLSIHGMKRIPVLVPPISEQTAIVRFLDYKDRRIRRVIRARQQQIKLLEEYRQALIHQAVTGQIDVRTGKPYPAYKDSGVEWLGKVPEHWEVVPLKRIVLGRLKYGANAAAEFSTPSWPRYIRITDFDENGGLRENTFRSLPPDVAKEYLLHPGDILLARSGATVGKSFLVGPSTGLACYASYLIRVRPNPARIIADFLFAFLQSHAFSEWRSAAFIVATIENISADKYGDLPVPIPTLEEQEFVVKWLKQRFIKIDAAIAAARREIELLREYRERLIADVVTGKVDVREAASLLPEEPPEKETDLIDADEIAEDEATDDDAATESLIEKEPES